jgi:hypothetical protein
MGSRASARDGRRGAPAFEEALISVLLDDLCRGSPLESRPRDEAQRRPVPAGCGVGRGAHHAWAHTCCCCGKTVLGPAECRVRSPAFELGEGLVYVLVG